MPLHSTANIAVRFAQDMFLEGAKPKDAVVEKKLIYRFAAIELQNSESIGTQGILHDHFDEGISSLQIIGEAKSKIDSQSTTALNKQTGELQTQRRQSLTEHGAWLQLFHEKGKNIAKKVNVAPDPEALLKQSPQTSQEIKGLEQQSGEFYQKARKLFADVEDAQQTHLISYKKQLNTIDERANYLGQKQLIEIEEKINRSSRMIKETPALTQDTHKPS